MPFKNEKDRIRNSRKYYLKNKERILENVKKYYFNNWRKRQIYRNEWLEENPEKVVKYKKKYIQSEKGKIAMKKALRKYYDNKDNKLKLQARLAIKQAIRSGEIIKPLTCEICECKTRLEGHHYKGYNKESHLLVMWLCVKCHKKQENEKNNYFV